MVDRADVTVRGASGGVLAAEQQEGGKYSGKASHENLWMNDVTN
jgi:hypothetical protein